MTSQTGDRGFDRYFARNHVDAQALREFAVTIVGAGTTGSAIAMLLAKAGVGRLLIVDPDVLEVENLHRQQLGARFVGLNKAAAMVETLCAEASTDQLFLSHPGGLETLDDRDLHRFVVSSDLLIAATGNDEADRRLNRMCREVGRPLIAPSLFAASNREFVGEVLVVPWHQAENDALETACFECEHPARVDARAGGGGLASPQGQAVDVWPVATLAAQLAIASFQPNLERGAWLRSEIAQGFNQFHVGRLVPTVIPTRTTARRDCAGCSPVLRRRWLRLPRLRDILARRPALAFRVARFARWRREPWTDDRIIATSTRLTLFLGSALLLGRVVYSHGRLFLVAIGISSAIAVWKWLTRPG